MSFGLRLSFFEVEESIHNMLAAASKMDAICLRALVLYYQYLRQRSAKQCSALFHKLATVLDELDCANNVFLTRAKMMLGGQLHYFSMGLECLVEAHCSAATGALDALPLMALSTHTTPTNFARTGVVWASFARTHTQRK